MYIPASLVMDLLLREDKTLPKVYHISQIKKISTSLFQGQILTSKLAIVFQPLKIFHSRLKYIWQTNVST